jgi:hemoglobin
MSTRSFFFAIVLGAAACGGGGKKADTTTTTDQASTGATLYDRLGKLDAIKAVVKDFVEEQVAKDDRINAKFFSNADLPKLQEHLVNQICEATGGPCKYTGRSMKEAHAGMGVDEASWNALVEDLKKSLAKFNVPQAEQDELIGALAKMHDDIVEKK